MFSVYIYGIIMGTCTGHTSNNDVWERMSIWQHNKILCERVGFPMQLFASTVFLLTMANNIIPMYKHTQILVCETFQIEDSDNLRGIDFTPRLTGNGCWITFFVDVFSKIVTWGSLVFAGILFLFRAPTNGSVIRSTVALVFICGVDELFWATLVPKPRKVQMENQKFKLTSNPKFNHQSSFFMTYLMLPVTILLCLIITLSIRGKCNASGQLVSWNDFTTLPGFRLPPPPLK